MTVFAVPLFQIESGIGGVFGSATIKTRTDKI